MNSTLFVTLATGSSLISIPMGYTHQLWWLFVPPIVFGTYFFGKVASSDAYRRQFGGAPVMSMMFLPNITVTAWNSAIQTGIFFAAWAVSLFFS